MSHSTDTAGAGQTSADLFDGESILPADPVADDGTRPEVLHDREYRVRAFRLADDRVVLRGAVRDQKPPGLYLDDDDPLTVHHMQIDMEVAYPLLEIVAVDVRLLTHPNEDCPRIEQHYQRLVGLSIARGFTHKVRELFGGPRGCTHTTALLQAMAPVAIQCIWSLRSSVAKRSGGGRALPSAEQRRAAWQMNLNTCHVWDAEGEWVAHLEAGGQMEPPIWIQERMVELGRKPEDWAQWMAD
jgi:hypothetical protein